MKSRFLRLFCAAFAASVLLSAFLPAPAASDTQTKTQLLSVYLSDDGNTLYADAALSDDFLKVYGACGVYLFEFYPYENFSDINEKAPSAELVAAKELKFEIDFSENAQTRKYCKYVLARLVNGEYQTFASAKYISNPGVLATNKEEGPSVKGIAGVISEDAAYPTDLGVSCSVVQVALNTLPADSEEGSAKIEYGERTYYIYKEALIALDNRVRELSENGIAVYLQLVLNAPDETTSQTARTLYRYVKDEDAMYYAIDTRDAESADLYAALVEFLAARYTRADQAYGYAENFIFGYWVNSNRHYYSMRETAQDKYITELGRTLRITDTAIRSAYPTAKLYVSLGGNFNSAAAYPDETPNEYLDYSGKDILDALCEDLSDVPFGVSWNASASDGPRADFWTDENAVQSLDTDFITVKNIEVLANYLKTPGMLCEGYVRDLIIGDFNASANDNTEMAQKLQAGAIVCAYLKALNTNGISAFFYGTAQDADDQALGLTDGSDMRIAYTAYQNILQRSETELAQTVQELLGEQTYAELCDGIFSGMFVPRTRLQLYTSSLPASGRISYIADFTDRDLYGFAADSNTAAAESIVDPVTGIILSIRGNANRAGICRSFEEYNLANADIINIELSAQTEDASATIYLSLTGKKDGKDVVYYGECSVSAGEWTQIAFEIPGIDTLQSMTLSGSSSSGGALTVYAKSISTYRISSDGMELAVRIILWILLLVTVFFLILYLRFIRIRSGAARRRAAAQAAKQNVYTPSAERLRYTYTSKHSANVHTPASVHAASENTAAPRRHSDGKQQHTKVPTSGKATQTTNRPLPEMPRTEPKTYIVPPKQSVPEKRKTMSLGIESTSVKDPQTGFDTTDGTTGK